MLDVHRRIRQSPKFGFLLYYTRFYLVKISGLWDEFHCSTPYSWAFVNDVCDNLSLFLRSNLVSSICTHTSLRLIPSVSKVQGFKVMVPRWGNQGLLHGSRSGSRQQKCRVLKTLASLQDADLSEEVWGMQSLTMHKICMNSFVMNQAAEFIHTFHAIKAS